MFGNIILAEYEVAMYRKRIEKLIQSIREDKEMSDILESKVKIEITGLSETIRFSLINFYDHLTQGGLVKIVFNSDASHMEITKVVIGRKEDKEMSIKKRKETDFMTEIPKESGRAVSMCLHKGQIILACEYHIYQLSEDTVFKKIRFEEFTNENT